MNKHIRKLFSAALAAAMLLGSLPAYASDALGHDLAASDVTVSSGVQLAAGTFWSDAYSDLRQEHYVVYTPNERVKPLVTCGKTARSLTTVAAAAKELEARNVRVVAGVNGDYYSVQYGMPVGSTMVGGVLRNANGDAHYAVGFRTDGTALIGDPKLSLRATVNGEGGFDVFAFDHLRQSEYGIFLYDHRFNDRGTTGTSETGVEVVCSVSSGALTIGGRLTLRVDEVLPESSDAAVPEGKYVLSANLRAGEAFTAPLLALQPGDEVVIHVSSGAGSAWNDVVNLIGAPELLVQNGTVVGGLPSGSAPRTAIGQKADGSLVFYTIDGRRSGYSIGASLTAVAMRLVELGCVTAVALDGGGSTTMVATTPEATASRVINAPSEGSLRAVSNQVFLVAPNTPGGTADHVYLAAEKTRALPGARVALTAAVIDTNFLPLATGRALSYSADNGAVSADGVLTVPETPGVVTVTAGYGGKSASVTVEVMEPESIVLRRNGSAVTSLTVAPESDVALTAEGIVNHLALAGDNSCFTWTYEGDGVTILPDGYTLRAGASAGAGTLTVGAGETSVSVPVTVAAIPLKQLDGFEDAFAPRTDEVEESEDAFARLTLSRETAGTRVKFGRASARLDYALDGESDATLPLDYAVGADYNSLNFWINGDGGRETMRVETDAGSVPVAPDALSATGWQSVTLALPAGAKRITGLTLGADEAASGTLWLDQLVLSYDLRRDEAAPETTLALDGETRALTGRAFDAVDGGSLSVLVLTLDGAALTYTYDKRTGALSAALPEADGLAHRVTLTAGDASGNLARRSIELPAAEDAEPAFPDTAGHWANAAAAYLKRAGISNGSGGKYHPDTNITRQEFAVMLYRYLAPEEDYGAVDLPFADSAQIAAWALPAAKAMYALGIVNGTSGAGGKVYFSPNADISRQEAVTMLGRLLEKGWSAPELSFSDSGAIPAWAAEHVRVLSALGVLGGYEDGSFRPAAPITRAQVAAVLFRLN